MENIAVLFAYMKKNKIKKNTTPSEYIMYIVVNNPLLNR